MDEAKKEYKKWEPQIYKNDVHCGALFYNKLKDNHLKPDLTGYLVINENEIWGISLWEVKTKNGNSFYTVKKNSRQFVFQEGDNPHRTGKRSAREFESAPKSPKAPKEIDPFSDEEIPW